MNTKSLEDVGLNIFLSASVQDIPSSIYHFTEEQKKKSLVMIGHGGKKLWENLPHPLDNQKNPIDEFSIFHMQRFARENLDDSDIEILFPHPKYTLPLQQLGRFFNLAKESPIKIDISNEFGLWFAYRGVFLTKKNLPLIKHAPFCSPCDSCDTRPCIEKGRSSCPYQTHHQYTSKQQLYHASQLALIK